MTSLGPTPTPRLEPLRPGDREPGRDDRQPPPLKPRRSRKKQDGEPDADFVQDEDHQLDERA